LKLIVFEISEKGNFFTFKQTHWVYDPWNLYI
jgi:hypothetical protein